MISVEPACVFFINLHEHITETSLSADYIYVTVMYKTIFVINIIIHMCLQHSNTLSFQKL